MYACNVRRRFFLKKMMEAIFNLQELQDIISAEKIVIVYYSNEACNVCKVLKPKIIETVNTEFPKSRLLFIDTEKSPVIAGQFRVFTIPTIDIYVEGKEHARFSRNVAMHDFLNALQKPYEIILG